MANPAVCHDALVGQTLGYYRIAEKLGAEGGKASIGAPLTAVFRCSR